MSEITQRQVPYYLPPQGYAFYERWLQNLRI